MARRITKTPETRKAEATPSTDGKPWIPACGIALLRKVQEAIRREPTSYAQNRWSCGTTMCIAGHAAILGGIVTDVTRSYDGRDDRAVCVPDAQSALETRMAESTRSPLVTHARKNGHAWADAAAMVLGIDDLSAGRLFAHQRQWPGHFPIEYDLAVTVKQRAEVACARIDHFIETGE